MPVLY